MKLSENKVAIFLENMVEESEFIFPYYRMKEEGAEVVIVSPKVDTYKGKHGVPFKSDKSIDEVTADDFDLLIIPGGFSPDYMRRSEAMINFVKAMNDNQKIIAAICHGPWMLASADILNGRKVTSFFSIKDDIINAGAEWVDEEAVYDFNLITSRNPNDLPAFCNAIINALVEKNEEVES